MYHGFYLKLMNKFVHFIFFYHYILTRPHNPTWSRTTTSTQHRHIQHIAYHFSTYVVYHVYGWISWWIIFLCFFPLSTWNWIPTQGRSVPRIQAPRKTLSRTTGFAVFGSKYEKLFLWSSGVQHTSLWAPLKIYSFIQFHWASRKIAIS